MRILAVNVIAPLALLVGLLYMDQYRDQLIRAELKTLQAQAQLYANAISEGAVRPVQEGRPFLFARPQEIEVLIPDLARRMVRRLGHHNQEARTRLFAPNGTLIADSYVAGAPPSSPAAKAQQNKAQAAPSSPANATGEDAQDPHKTALIWVRHMAGRALSLIPSRSILPDLPDVQGNHLSDFPDARAVLRGTISATAWRGPDGRIVMSASSPVLKVDQLMGVVHLTRAGGEIEAAMNDLRLNVLSVFLGSLSITIFLSLYLASTIAAPLKKLGRAAEAVRTGKGRAIDLPYLTHREDEIGDLSQALHDMTQALQERMDTIKNFAADVAHEIKNPLTSLQSAVETVERVKDEDKRSKLMAIILHDIKRLDRLISDISNASRLDAELSRDKMEPVDLGQLLQQIVDLRRAPLERVGDQSGGLSPVRLILERGGIPGADMYVSGSHGRLAQIFDNLLSNAVSFSPPGGKVTIRILPDHPNPDFMTITVEDEGPGIPEGKLETIFERFYTERPKHEAYGAHSGLGLSIVRQIVLAHKGKIWAENIRAGGVHALQGAKFTVVLPRAQS